MPHIPTTLPSTTVLWNSLMPSAHRHTTISTLFICRIEQTAGLLLQRAPSLWILPWNAQEEDSALFATLRIVTWLSTYRFVPMGVMDGICYYYSQASVAGTTYRQ
jgi:hypothetical protein